MLRHQNGNGETKQRDEAKVIVEDPTRIVIDERLSDHGDAIATYLARTQEGVAIFEGQEQGELPIRAVATVMRRYGRELEDGIVPDGHRVDFPGIGTLQRLRFHAQVDAEGRDYVVWTEPGRAPVVALSCHVAAALRHLAIHLPLR